MRSYSTILSVGCVAGVLTVLGTPAHTQPSGVPQSLASDFTTRVQRYMATREDLLRAGPTAGERAAPEVVLSQRASLNERLRTARRTSKPGEILFSELAVAIGAIFRSDSFRMTGRQAIAMARETDKPPDNVPIPRVNQEYPKELGLVSPPATVLIQLPELPEALEYRLIGPHLILRDIDANLIVDVAPNVLPAR